ncbi:hypothetical protein MTR_7g069520 [Medicago truncatula]|uniref:Uncharacterized protein n=1 Tax=Medicago truncatula TaxID=3880 RepID=G7KSB4_MEDTR|nr:hypothetical protein MTR_7g069520 [Medicago truncatula]
MSFANSKPFRIAKASATSESGNEKTCQELAPRTTPSLSLTQYQYPTYHLPSDLLYQH